MASQSGTGGKPPPQPFEVALARKLQNRSSSLRSTFLSLDVDGNGSVTRSDLANAFHNLLGIDLTSEQTDALFTRFAYFEKNRGDADSNVDEEIRRELVERQVKEKETLMKEQEREKEELRRKHDRQLAELEDRCRSELGDGFHTCPFVVRTRSERLRERGIRYGEFVSYIRETASESVSSASLYGSTLGLRIDPKDLADGDGMPRLRSVRPPPGTVTSEMRAALVRLIRQKTHSGSGRMKETDLFLKMDTNRSGVVTPDQFRDWAADVGLELTKGQVRQILGEHYKPAGINMREFAKVIEDIDGTSGGAGKPHPWEVLDEEEVKRRSVALKRADSMEEARRLEDLRNTDDDVRTDRAIIRSISKRLFERKTTLLNAFRKYDTDGTGRLTASELRAALGEAGMHVSEERAESLVTKFDVDGDGRLNKVEFIRLISWSGSEDDASDAGRAVRGGDATKEARAPAPAGAPSTEEKREALVSSMTGHEDEARHREVANRLDHDDIETILSFRRALEKEKIIAQRAFQSIDKDHSRDLSPEELMVGFQKLGIDVSRDHMDHILKRFDTDHTGKLKYSQFIHLLSENLDE